MSSVRRHSIKAIMRRDDVDAVLSGVGWPNYADGLTAKENLSRLQPDSQAVLWYKPEGTRDVKTLIEPKNIGVPAILRFNECWWPENKAANEVVDSGSSIVICHHWNDILRFTHPWKLAPLTRGQREVHHNGTSVYNIHHCAKKSIYFQASRPWDKRDIDLLVVGVTSREIYPLRTQIKDLIGSGKVKGIVRPHPGYRTRSIEENDAQVLDYAIMLGRSKCVVSCSSVYHYALAKFPEIAMAGACLVADAPGECLWYSDLWNGCFKPVDVAMPITSLTSMLNELPHTAHAKQIAKRGQIMALEHFTQDQYAKRFVSSVKDHLRHYG